MLTAAHFAPSAVTPKFRPPLNNACGCPAVSTTTPAGSQRGPCEFKREPGGRGRIRTFVARKERQIYSLLVLATHPPVPVLVFQGNYNFFFASGSVKQILNPEKRWDETPVPKSFVIKHLCKESAKTQNGLVSKDT